MKIRCALCNGIFEDFGDGDRFCVSCERKLAEFFNEATQVDDVGDPDDFIDWDLLADELDKGLIIFDGYKLISTGSFPSWRISE